MFQEFELNTPDFEATKIWSGNMGKNATHAVVYAQLYTPQWQMSWAALLHRADPRPRLSPQHAGGDSRGHGGEAGTEWPGQRVCTCVHLYILVWQVFIKVEKVRDITNYLSVHLSIYLSISLSQKLEPEPYILKHQW